MRKSVISSAFTTVVAYANDCLVAAGVALRSVLQHMNLHQREMREHPGNWFQARVLGRERSYQPRGCSSTRSNRGFASTTDSMTNVVSRLWQIAFSKRPTLQALALCPAYAAIARISSAQQG